MLPDSTSSAKEPPDLPREHPYTSFLLAEYNNIAQAHFNTGTTLTRFFQFYLLVLTIPITLAAAVVSATQNFNIERLVESSMAPFLALFLFVIAVVGFCMLGYVSNLRFDALLYARTVKGQLGPKEMRQLIELDDRHLRGGKFDWESFLFRRYSKLKEDAVTRLQGKAKKARPPDAEASPQQVRIGLCVKSWGRETPEVLVAYNLFCDLVHPNIGSTFLIASIGEEGLYFSRFRGQPVGRAILEQSLPILLSVCHREFGRYLAVLMGTIWDNDEVRG